jgi:XRE family transcriptional regulator, aerobic/anaerobic benzoate catabolism transcriptional regulator
MSAPDPLLMALAERTRTLRKHRGWTMRELAERSGLSLRFLMQIEGGRGNVSVRRLGDLARALECAPAELLSSVAPARPRVIVSLLGLRGAGKSTVGRRLARRLKRPFVELDRRVEEAAGLSLNEIFSFHGEEYYRKLEYDTLERLIREATPIVLAVGGGIVTSPQTFVLLRQHTVTVWLRARPADYWNRVVRQGDRRPMADHPQAMEALRTLLASREPLYSRALHTVDTSQLDVDKVVQEVDRVIHGQNVEHGM